MVARDCFQVSGFPKDGEWAGCVPGRWWFRGLGVGVLHRCRLVAGVVIMLAFVACGKSEVPVDDEPGAESYTVGFSFGGEVTISEEPLGRSATGHLYGINIFYDKEKDGVMNDIYGYGLFDAVESMRVSLLTGYRYRFVCTLVKEGKEKVYRDGSGYSFPFKRRSGTSYSLTSTALENKFIVGDGYYFEGLGNGRSFLDNGKGGYEESYYPGTDRYYGETEGYEPTPNGTVVINLKRCSYGIRFIVKGVSGGELTIRGGSGTESLFEPVSVTTPTLETEGTIHAFRDVESCWRQESYSRESVIQLTWRRANDVVQELEEQRVTLKRNVMTVMTIDLEGSTGDSFVGVVEDDAPMQEEEVGVNVDAGDETDTGVDPKPGKMNV